MSTPDFQGPVGNASAKYESDNPLTRALLRRFLAEVDRLVAELDPSSVLDVGCGEGIVTERIAVARRDATVVGVDADDAGLRADWEQRRHDNLSFAVASAYALPYENDSFELACSLEVLEHLERPAEALAEMTRVARRAVLVSVPREPLWRISHVLAGRNVRRLGDTPGHLNHWSSGAFVQLVGNYGRVAAVRRPFPWTIALVEL